MDNISIIKAKSSQQFRGISSYSKYSKKPSRIEPIRIESKSFSQLTPIVVNVVVSKVHSSLHATSSSACSLTTKPTKSNQIIKSKPNQSLHGNPRLLALGSMAADLIESFSILYSLFEHPFCVEEKTRR